MRLAALLLVACLGAVTAHAEESDQEARARIRMTGFLRARTSESIQTPSARDEWSYNIMFLSPEGASVKPGDTVAKLEGENLKKRVQEVTNQLLQAKVKGEGKISDLKTTIDGLKKTYADDESELRLLETGAKVAAAAGDWAVSSRDRMREQLDIESRTLKLTLKAKQLARKERLLSVVEKTFAKDVAGLETSVEKMKEAVASGERKASTAGIVVYKRSTRDRQKPRVGSSVHRGTEVLAIVDDRDLYVEAFLREEDWRHVKAGQKVDVRILGRREQMTSGVVTKLSAIVMKGGDWDRTLGGTHPLFERRVFKLEVKLDAVPEIARPDGEVEVSLGGGTA